MLYERQILLQTDSQSKYKWFLNLGFRAEFYSILGSIHFSNDFILLREVDTKCMSWIFSLSPPQSRESKPLAELTVTGFHWSSMTNQDYLNLVLKHYSWNWFGTSQQMLFLLCRFSQLHSNCQWVNVHKSMMGFICLPSALSTLMKL